MPQAAPLPNVPLTPWHMILSADIVVQAVMLLLLAASVATWTILLAKGIEVARARRRLGAALRRARRDGVQTLADLPDAPLAHALMGAAAEEIRMSDDLPPEGTKDRIALHLRRIEHGAIRRLNRGTGLLASIGAAGPFVGLFGTVWGIMDSFVNIARSQTTNLAVVAPGIAEALLATAFGLAAAIPAVLTYNIFARLLSGYRAQLGDLGALVLAHAAREIDRSQAAGRSARQARPIPLRAAAE
jgi:biopolymer transport protein ExbB